MLHFSVGRYAYRVVVESRVLLDGVEVEGLCDWRNRIIRLAAHLDQDQRRRVLRHEHWHAIEQVFGKALTSEDQADRHAAASDELDQQLTEQGGWAALDRLYDDHRAAQQLTVVPIEAAPASEYTYPIPGRQGPKCPRCGRSPAPGAVTNSQPQWDFDVNSMVLTRHFECAACEVRVRWRELGDNLGYPRGIVIDDAPEIVEMARV